MMTTLFTATSLWDGFRAAAGDYADSPAAAMGADVWTYKQLFAAADGARRWLEANVAEGPVLFVPKNTLASLAFLLGSIGSKKIPLIADAAWQAHELIGIMERCGAASIACEGSPPAGLPPFTRGAARGGITLSHLDRRIHAFECIPPAENTSFGRFTSGSTGFSRCLQFRDRAALAAAASWCEATEMSSFDRVLCLATLNNGLAFNTSLFTVLFSGGMLALHSGLLTRGSLTKTLAHIEPTILVAFPWAYELLTSGNNGAPASPKMRLAVSSAAPLGDEIRLRWLEATGLPICDYYGLVEAGPCTFNDGSVPGSLGVPLPGVNFATTAEDGRQLDVGQTGRIRVKTHSMASAYLDRGQPDFASHLDERNYFVTQDRGALRPDGRLTLHGRIGRLVNVAGRKIDPGEVETIIGGLTGVRGVVVRGEADAGRTLLAAYIESSTVHREQVVAHCMGRLAQYKLPQRIVIMAELPRSSAGKISVAAIGAAEGGAS